MNRAQRVLAAATCLLALAASIGAASASAAGNWFIEKTALSTSVEIEAEIDSETIGFLIPSLNLQLVFKKITYDKVSLLKGGETSYVYLLTEGAVYTISPKTLQKQCTPGDLTFDATGSLFLHGEKTYERLTPLSGKPLTITTYPESCQLGETNSVTGELILEDSTGSFSSEAISHLVRQAPATLFPGQMKFGELEMNMTGSWTEKLKGKEAGKKWSGLA